MHHGAGADKSLAENNRRYIEVMIGFHGDRNPTHSVENLSETPGDQKEGMAELILKLAKEILKKSHRMMVETYGKGLGTLLTLRFPIERRKGVYYVL